MTPLFNDFPTSLPLVSEYKNNCRFCSEQVTNSFSVVWFFFLFQDRHRALSQDSFVPSTNLIDNNFGRIISLGFTKFGIHEKWKIYVWIHNKYNLQKFSKYIRSLQAVSQRYSIKKLCKINSHWRSTLAKAHAI